MSSLPWSILKRPFRRRAASLDRDRDSIRSRVANRFIEGSGVEIGGGAAPHAVDSTVSVRHYDVRDGAGLAQLFGKPVAHEVRPISQLRSDFPSGCDFLIAHNVLEHAVDPIRTLVSWHESVRAGGTVVLSLPHIAHSYDRTRRLPSADHLLLDYLLKRDHLAFESKEHIPGFILAWLADTWFKDRASAEVANIVLAEAARDEGHDLHWHTFDVDLSLLVVLAACVAGNRPARLLACAHPASSPIATIGDIIVVYRLDEAAPDSFPDSARGLLRDALSRVVDGLESARALAASADRSLGKHK